MINVITIHDVKLKIGILCKKKRKARRLSREVLADQLNMSRTTIQNIEEGKNATLDNLLKIAYHFDLLSDIYSQLDKLDYKTIDFSYY